eukprot:58727_1
MNDPNHNKTSSTKSSFANPQLSVPKNKHNATSTNHINGIKRSPKASNIHVISIDATQKPRASPRKWTTQEHETFLHGLETHGRNWEAISLMEGIANRSKYSVSSHAQRHFAKLWRDGLPLPAKVQESGTGYTLSGEPLDPHSRTAQNMKKHKQYPPSMEYAMNKNKSKSLPSCIEGITALKRKRNLSTQTQCAINALSDHATAFADIVTKTTQRINTNTWRDKPRLKDRSNIFSDAHDRYLMHNTKRFIGVSYSLPMDVEGFKPDSGAVKHLAPLSIRPDHLGLLNEDFMDITYAMYFRHIWFTPQIIWKQIIEQRKDNMVTASPFDVLNPAPLNVSEMIGVMDDEERKVDDTHAPRIKECHKVSIVYDKTDTRTYDMSGSMFIPTMHHCVGFPDIPKQLSDNRVFNVVYFSFKDMRAIAANQIVKKWGLMDGGLRRELFNANHGKYMVIYDLKDIFDEARNGVMEPSIFFIHFKFHPLIGIQTFGVAGSFEDIANEADVVMYIRFNNAVGYLSKEEKQRNREIRKAQRLGVVVSNTDEDTTEDEEVEELKRYDKGTEDSEDSEYDINQDMDEIMNDGFYIRDFLDTEMQSNENHNGHHMDVDHVSNDDIPLHETPRKRRSYADRDVSDEIQPCPKKQRIHTRRRRRHGPRVQEATEVCHRCDECNIQFFDETHHKKHMEKHNRNKEHLATLGAPIQHRTKKRKIRRPRFGSTSARPLPLPLPLPFLINHARVHPPTPSALDDDLIKLDKEQTPLTSPNDIDIQSESTSETKPEVKTKPKAKRTTSKQNEMIVKSGRRINVRIELLVAYELFKNQLSQSQQTLLNSIMDYFATYFRNEMRKRNNAKAPFYSIHTRDSFTYPLTARIESRTTHDQVVTKNEYYMPMSQPCVDYMEWRMNDEHNIKQHKAPIESSRNKEQSDRELYIESQMALLIDDLQQQSLIVSHPFSFKSNDTAQDKIIKRNKVRSGKEEMDRDSDEDEVMVDDEDEHTIHSRMINGSQWIRAGGVAFHDIFTEEELQEIERLLDELQAKSERNEHRRYTSQSTTKRTGILVRTKHFFGARYLWHPSDFVIEGKEKSIGNGLRTDVDDVPPALWKLVERKLVECGLIPKDWIEGIAFNMYHDGTEGIGPHFDDIERFERPIVTIRLYSDARIAFGTDLYGTSNGIFSIPLPRGCVLLMQPNSFATDGIKHTVRPCDMYTKSAAIVLRRFQQQALAEAKHLEKVRQKNGYYEMDSDDDAQGNKRIIHAKGGITRNVRNASLLDDNSYTADGFCVADDEPIEYDEDCDDDEYSY